MQIKNRKNILIIFLLSLFVVDLNVCADEFNITANEILIDKENEIIIGKGSVEAVDSEGKTVYADKITYEKFREYLLAEGNVKIDDINGNFLTSNKATYDKINEIITTYDNTELILKSYKKLFMTNYSNILHQILYAVNFIHSTIKPFIY